MRNLVELPDDILICIFSACDIETLSAARLTCTTFSVITKTYIKAIAPKVARNTYPRCNLVLKSPNGGYTLEWLRSRIPAQLASIVLDKDKIRRNVCVNSGFPYGVPSESDCDEAIILRARITNGWRVMRSMYLVSKEVYTRTEDEVKRPDMLRRASSGMRGSRLWQAVSCPYPGCTQHGMKHLLHHPKIRRSSESSYTEKSDSDDIQNARKRELIVLESRLALIERLPDQDLLSYVYLWRLLNWTFRPYRRPEETAWNFVQGWQHDMRDIPHPAWAAMIHDIWNGCSWLTWYILHIGPSPFIQQWSLDATSRTPLTSNLIRNMIWKAWSTRSPHQIEIEREFVCKFEFALRKRCLSSERRHSLMTEISQGRTIRTISLDCIPWAYDSHPLIVRRPSDFPWYRDGQWIWLDGDWFLQTRPGTWWSQPGTFRLSLARHRGNDVNLPVTNDVDDVGKGTINTDKGPLEQVQYLIYLGMRTAAQTWPGCDRNGNHIAF